MSSKPTLDQLIDGVEDYYEITDEAKRSLAIVFSVYFEQFVKGNMLWLHIVEGSGGLKTTTTNFMAEYPRSYNLNELTSRTFTSTLKADRKDDKTIGERHLEGIDGKVWLLQDLTWAISQNENDRKAIYAFFRDLAEGRMTYGSGKEIDILNKKVRTTVITGVTPTIDRQGFAMTILGERFAKTRLNLRAKHKEIIHKAFMESGNEDENIDMMRMKFKAFADYWSEDKFACQSELLEKLKHGLWVSKFEALAEFVANAGAYCHKENKFDVLDEPDEQFGTRPIKYFVKMSVLLMILMDRMEFDDELWSIVLKFGEDQLIPLRLELVKMFYNHNFAEMSTYDIHKAVGISYNNTKLRLAELEAMKVVSSKWNKNVEREFFTLSPEIEKLLRIIYGNPIVITEPDKPQPKPEPMPLDISKTNFPNLRMHLESLPSPCNCKCGKETKYANAETHEPICNDCVKDQLLPKDNSQKIPKELGDF